MKIAIAGGTGLTGRLVVAELEAAGHEAVVLSRSTGVDLTTGTGLAERLDGVDALVDVTNIVTSKEAEAVGFFDAITTTLLAAAVPHHVALSIVGIDRVDFPYYKGKLRQEELIRASGRPATIVRATQFHEFPGQLLERTSFGPLVVAPKMRAQPIAVREVAAHLAAVATQRPGTLTGELAGPKVEEMADMIRRLLKAAGRRRLIVPARIPGAGGRAMAGGALLPAGEAILGHQDFSAWLASPDAQAWLSS